MDSAPIFIVGSPRSGTTLLRLVLNSHPRIGIPVETGYFPAVYERFSERRGSWEEAVELFVGYCERRFLPPLALEGERAALLALNGPDYERLLTLPVASWAAAQGKPRWGEKTPFHIFYAGSIMRLFPAAKLLVMVRDPRAAVASMNRFGAIGSGTALNARLWRDVYTDGITTVEQFVPREQAFTVRYESLIVDPEHTLTGVCNFLGENFDPVLLDFHESTAAYDRLADTPKTSQPIHGDPDGWRAKLSERDVAIIETICGPQMEALGYARVGRRLRAGERLGVGANITYATMKHWQHRRQRYHPVVYPPFARFRRTS
jgi:hypothetical protein